MRKITQEQLKELKKGIVLEIVDLLHVVCPKTKSGRHYPSMWKGFSGRKQLQCDCCGMFMNK